MQQRPGTTWEGRVVFADGSQLSLQCHEGRVDECPGVLDNGYECEGPCPEMEAELTASVLSQAAAAGRKDGVNAQPMRYFADIAAEIAEGTTMTADTPDTGKILLDIERAATRARDYLAQAETDSEVARGLAKAVENLLDHWSYLRYCLEQEGAPLPAVWVLAAPPAPFTRPDEQLGHLRRAGLAFGEWLENHPQLADPSLPADPASNPAVATRMLAEKGDHLAAYAAAVDDMCCRARTVGDLPSDWQPRDELRVGDLGGVPVPGTWLTTAELADPRVGANNGAAAKAGWDLSATTLDTVIVTRAGVRVTIEQLDPNQVFDTDPFGEGTDVLGGLDPF